MQVGPREVDAERNLVEAGVLELNDEMFRKTRCSRRHGSDTQTASLAIGNEFTQVLSRSWVAAAQHQEGSPEVRHLVNERTSFVCAEFPGNRTCDGTGTTVAAREVACLSRLPDDQER
jgi:hypothetical protein